MIRLVATPTVHNHNHLAVVHNALTTVCAVVIGYPAALVTRGNVGFRFLFCHDNDLRCQMSNDAGSLSLSILYHTLFRCGMVRRVIAHRYARIETASYGLVDVLDCRRTAGSVRVERIIACVCRVVVRGG